MESGQFKYCLPNRIQWDRQLLCRPTGFRMTGVCRSRRANEGLAMTRRERQFLGWGTACLFGSWVSVALASNDLRGLDPPDENGRPSSLIVGTQAAPLAPESPPPLRGNPLWAISFESLHSTRERPLFTPARRPPMPPVTAPPAEPIKVAAPVEPDQPPPSLLGIITGTTERFAVFASPTTHDNFSLRPGEGHGGWILQSVDGRQVVLEYDHRTVVLALPHASGDNK